MKGLAKLPGQALKTLSAMNKEKKLKFMLEKQQEHDTWSAEARMKQYQHDKKMADMKRRMQQ